MASIFSGKAGRNAALWTEKQANWQRGENTGFIEQGFTNAKDALQTGYDASLKPLEDFYTTGQDFLKTGMTDANAAIMTGLNQGRGDVTRTTARRSTRRTNTTAKAPTRCSSRPPAGNR